MAVRVGIIGLGRIGHRQLRCATGLSSWVVSAVADPREADLDVASSAAAVFTRWERMLDEAPIDAVSICTPHDTHATIAMAALRAGKHVLVEKPIAPRADEARAVVDEARRQNAVLMVELTHRFYPPVIAARDYLRAGHIGEIYAVEDRIIEPASDQIAPWLLNRSNAGGGVALTNGFHMLDRIAAVTGRSLRYIGGRAGHSAMLGDIEDTAAMLLALDDGTPVQLLAAWPRGGGQVDDELTIYGTKGTLRIRAWHGWRADPIDPDQPSHEERCYPDEMGLSARVDIGVRGAMAQFADAVIAGKTPEPSPDDALDAHYLIDAFYRDVLPGERVR